MREDTQMKRSRVNDLPEEGTYISRARQAIEDGEDWVEESGEKQAGDGYAMVSIEKLKDDKGARKS